MNSVTADDVQWLAFASVGSQIYLVVEDQWPIPHLHVSPGQTFGGAVSLAPVQVQSWLGPQTGVVGNAFMEWYVGVPEWNVRFGVRGELSLSSIWPGDLPLPVGVEPFLGWNPTTSFALRVWGAGIAGSPLATTGFMNPYGLRLEYFVP
jgi:hypothetical protein